MRLLTTCLQSSVQSVKPRRAIWGLGQKVAKLRIRLPNLSRRTVQK